MIVIPITIFSQEKVGYRNAKNENISFQISKEYHFINYQDITDESKIKSNVKEFTTITKHKCKVSLRC